MTVIKNSRAGRERQKRGRPSGPLKDLKFFINLDDETWQKIKPVESVYKDGCTYVHLNPPWTNTIVKAVYAKHPLPCAWNFTKAQVYKRQDSPYFKFFGSCKECKARIDGVCNDIPVPDTGVKIFISTSDTTKIPHVKTRRLAKGERKEAQQTLRYIKASHYKQLKANEVLSDSGTAPPLLHNTNVYRTARQQARDEDIGLAEFPGNPITTSLSLMDRISSIREISTVPLVVWYWSDNQLKLWNEAAELNIFISVDASGRFVKAVNIFDGHKSGHVFLYNIVIRLGGKIYTIAQMLSDCNDSHCIFTWISAWIKSGASIPKEAVVDCSMALLNAISLACNGCYYQDYLSKCYRFLIKQNDTLPHCLIKRDRAHLIKAVLRWKCFFGQNKSDFHARCIAFSLELEDFALFQQVMTAMFVVCLSQNADKGTECDKRKSWLEEKIETFDHSKYYTKEDSLKNDAGGDNNFKFNSECGDSNDISKFVHKIYNDSLLLCSSDESSVSTANNYYLPKITDNLIMLFQQFPAWTNVMRIPYASTNTVSTSIGSECHYRIMRHDYGLNSPISLNRFLLTHLRIIDGATKLGRGVIKQVTSTPVGNMIGNQNHMGIIPVSSEKNLDPPDSMGNTTLSLNKAEEKCSDKVLESTDISRTDVANFSDSAGNLVNHYMRANGRYITVAHYVCKEDAFCVLEHHVLWSNEFLTLKPQKWIDGSVIDSFMIMKSKDWKNVSFFPTSQTVYMIGDHHTQNKPKSWPMYNINFEFRGMVFLPYCFKSHWCLLVLNIDERSVTHLDPLIETHSGDHTVEAFLTYLKECNPEEKNSLCSIDWQIISATNDRPIQRDGYNCAAFVMYYMDCLAKRVPCSNVDFDPNVYRHDIAQQLISSSQSMCNMGLYCLNDKEGVCSTCRSCNRWVHNECVFKQDTKLNQDRIVLDGTCSLCLKH